MPMKLLRLHALIFFCYYLGPAASVSAAESGQWKAGLAKVVITPDKPQVKAARD
jgi:hypothetical protein